MRETAAGSVEAVTAERAVSTTVDGAVFERYLNLSRRECIVAAFIGCLVVLAFCRGQFSAICEYPAIYNGARLLGFHHLYDPAYNHQEQIHEVGGYSAALSYVRLPFYAVLVWPLGQLSYHTSLIIWEACSAIALGLFIYLWPITGRAFTATICGWSLPVALTFLFAEDDLWLLVALALFFRWAESKPRLAGVAASLLSIKFHLFLLLPLLFIGQKRWKMAFSFIIACCVLVGVSFVAGGIAWPVDLWRLLSTNAILPREYVMPNIRGLLSSVTESMAPELAIDALIALVVFQVLRRTTFQMGAAATLVGSLLVSHHAGPEDCVVLIPALLVLGASRPRTVPYCLLLLSPVCYAFLSYGGFLSDVTVLVITSILGVLAWNVFRNPPLAQDDQLIRNSG